MSSFGKEHAGDDGSLHEAARWMARITGEPLSAADQQALHDWLRADPRNVVAMQLVERTWITAGRMREKRTFDAQRRRARVLRLATPDNSHRPARRHLMVAATVATLAMAVFAIAFIFPPADFATASTHTALHGQSVEVRLPDGTVVRLNTDSVLRVRYRWLARSVELLKGEASFTVAHEHFRPFLVFTGKLSIKATGTVFTVRDMGPQTRVFLAEGGVQVIARSRDEVLATLKPGERLTMIGSTLAEVVRADPDQELAWRNGQVVFVGTSLREAAAQFGRYTDVQVSIANELTDLNVSGAYRNTDVIAFLNTLTRIHPVQWRWVGAGRVIVEPARRTQAAI